MLRKAIVVATHPEDNSVDLVMCDNGARMPGVPVLSASGDVRSGSSGLPEIEQTKGGDQWDVTGGRGKQMEAMVGFMGRGNPVVVGFMVPQISQMTFEDKKRSFSRHQSDVYQTTDGEGNFEMYHPSGAYMRLAEKTEHEDLSSKNYDKNLKLDRNTKRKVSWHFSTKDGKSTITLDPEGKVTIKGAKELHIDAPLVSGTGKLEFKGDGVFGGISVMKHLHKDTMPGPGLSGMPVGGVSEGGVAGGGGESSNGGANGGASDANTPSLPGNPETAGTFGNGIANDASGIFRGAIQTRVPFLGTPNIEGAGIAEMNFAYAFANFPARPDMLGIDTFYERVRQSAIGIFDGGMMQALVSQFDRVAETWTDDVIDIAKWEGGQYVDRKIGTYLGAIQGGILPGGDKSAPFDVYRSRGGDHYAKYCDWGYRAFITNAVVVGTRPVYWKLTEEEAATIVPA